MAIYHFGAKVISRSAGRSVVAAAAYRAAEMLEDLQTVRRYDYRAKAGVVHSVILLPDGAPARLLDRSTLWNEVEATERRKDAQLARDIELSLPRELSQAAAIQLAHDFVSEQFVARGMIADLNVHWGKTKAGEDQPHVHVMLTMRSVGPDGFGPKVRDWNASSLLVDWRERWATLANERLSLQGHDVRIDHRSNAAQGIALEPQNKIGPAGARRTARGEEAERAAEHAAIARRNGEQIIAEPERVLQAITQQQSTFTRQELARLVNRHTVDAAQFTRAMAVVEASAELVRVGQDGRGRMRFSTREMLAVERRLEATAIALSVRRDHAVGLDRRQAAMSGTMLGREQALALGHVTRARDLAVVVGYAGTGKSTMLGAARAVWEAEGYRVRGAALSGIAAEGLEGGAGIESRTLASLELAWRDGRERLERGDVLVVDEAGLIGSRQMERLLSAVHGAGAKLVLVGDPEQLQAIEAGAAFRAVAERVGTMEITTVRRQRAAWQQAATKQLATGRTDEALARYTEGGMVHGHATTADAKAALVAGWDAARRQSPGSSQIILAHTRVDVRDLNEQARSVRRAAGELGADQLVMTELGERQFAEGDRVYFLRNDRGLGVKNGTLGTIEYLDEVVGDVRLSVRLDGADGAGTGRAVDVALSAYGHIDHGYAATMHKSQGVTVDRAHVLATAGMDRHMSYVGLTRHRDAVALHWSGEAFGDASGLMRVLGRERLKDTSLDYGAGLPDEAADQAYAERRGLLPDGPVLRRARALAEQAAALRDRAAQGLAAYRERLAQRHADGQPGAVLARRLRRHRAVKVLRDVVRTMAEDAARQVTPLQRLTRILDLMGQRVVPPPASTDLQVPSTMLRRYAEFRASMQAERAAEAAWQPVLLPALPYTGRDSFGRGLSEREFSAVCAADPMCQAAVEQAAALLTQIWREPREAGQRLDAAIGKVGLVGAARALEAEGGQVFGAMLGRPGKVLGLFGGESETHVQARRAASKLAVTLRDREEADHLATQRYEVAVRKRMRRDQVEVPNLSLRAQAAAERLGTMSPWDEGLLRTWREVAQDTRLVTELEGFVQAVSDRVGPPWRVPVDLPGLGAAGDSMTRQPQAAEDEATVQARGWAASISQGMDAQKRHDAAVEKGIRQQAERKKAEEEAAKAVAEAKEQQAQRVERERQYQLYRATLRRTRRPGPDFGPGM